MGVESQSHEIYVRLEPYTRGVDDWHPISFVQEGSPLSTIWGNDWRTASLSLQARWLSEREHPTKREGHATRRIHSYAALDTMIQFATKHDFHVPSLCFDSIKHPTCFQEASRVR